MEIWERKRKRQWDREYENGNRTANMGLGIWERQPDKYWTGTGNEIGNGIQSGMGARRDKKCSDTGTGGEQGE